MEDLIALVRIYKLLPANQRVRLTRNGAKNMKMVYRFIEDLIDGKITSDAQASMLYFNEGPTNPRFYSLRKRVVSKLLCWITNSENPYLKQDTYESASITSNLLSSQAGVLLDIGAFDMAHKINLSILRLAEKWQFTEIAERAARNICDYHAFHEVNPRKFLHFQQICRDLRETWKWEIQASDVFAGFMLAFHTNKEGRITLESMAQIYIQDLERILIHKNSVRVKQYLVRIQIISLIAGFKFSQALKLAIEMMQELEETTSLPLHLRNELLQSKMVCYLNTKQFEEGKRVAENLVTIRPVTSEIRLSGMEVNFMLSLHDGKFNEAMGIYLNTLQLNILKESEPIIQEKWLIYESYLFFLHQIGQITHTEADTFFKPFRFARFLNEVPMLNREKRGLNIAILIIEFLLCLVQGKTEWIFARHDALKKYSSRYLNQAENRRSYLFLRALLQIPVLAFNWKLINEKSKQFPDILQENPNLESSLSFGAEIIPYDVLWALVISYSSSRKAG